MLRCYHFLTSHRLSMNTCNSTVMCSQCAAWCIILFATFFIENSVRRQGELPSLAIVISLKEVTIQWVIGWSMLNLWVNIETMHVCSVWKTLYHVENSVSVRLMLVEKFICNTIIFLSKSQYRLVMSVINRKNTYLL